MLRQRLDIRRHCSPPLRDIGMLREHEPLLSFADERHQGRNRLFAPGGFGILAIAAANRPRFPPLDGTRV